MIKVKLRFIFLLSALTSLVSTLEAQIPAPTRLREVFRVDTLFDADAVPRNTNNGAWEIVYEPVEDSLWITENREYTIRKLATRPPFGSRIVLRLDSATGTIFTPNVRATFSSARRTQPGNVLMPWPQGGMMGMAIHPQFLAASNPKNFVYVAYVRDFVGPGPAAGQGTRTATNPFNGEAVKGDLFTTYLVRFEYLNGFLTNPAVICDSIPGSNDHNSGRMLIANGHLYYSVGDMGSGQFWSSERKMKSDLINSYEGKILRFLLEPTGTGTGLDRWIPNDNPYNNVAPVVGKSAVHSIGHRNVQGLGFLNGKIYASSHGPFSDDEINILEPGKDYGHPRVIGMKADGNYTGLRAARPTHTGGSGPTFVTLNSILPIINEAANITNYVDPIYSFYDASKGATNSIISNIITNNPSNQTWPSIAPSGMDVYTAGKIPGWNNSLLHASLKDGSVFRQKLSSDGNSIVNIDSHDTLVLFSTLNRFRDLAIDENGFSIYASVDGSGQTSGPTETNPVNSSCEGCILKYTFRGYNDNSGLSTIPTIIPIAPGTDNTCETLSSPVINADNNNLWVPITDANGNIVAEIKANGRNLGAITASIYKHNGANMRQDSRGRLYMNRNIAITPATQPGAGNFVDVRLYFTNAELTAIQGATNTGGQSSGITGPSNLGIFKTNGGCTNALSGNGTLLATESSGAFGANGRFIEISTDQFSQFFFGNNNSSILPITLSNFKAAWVANQAALSWNTLTEETTQYFVVERSTDSRKFDSVLTIRAKGQSNLQHAYTAIDASVSNLAATTFYYRLKIVDADGKSSYSATAKLSKDGAGFFVKAFPNPVRNQATLSIFAAQDENFVWKLTDLSGRTVLSKSGKVFRGQNTFTIDMNQLPAGIYQLSVNAPSFSENLKLQKQ